MAIWQWALVALGVAWAVQSVGVWVQMRHYKHAFKDITAQFEDGYVGAGHARGRWRQGTIAVVVVSSDLVVQKLLLMTGRSVFTKFVPVPQVEGMTLNAFRVQSALGACESETRAIALALEQVDRVRARKAPLVTEESLAIA